jgi:hypothetical protein
MVYGADVVSIAATTAGVTGTITVPSGAHLRNITFACAPTAAVAEVITIIELTWANSPTPLRFTPNMIGVMAGTAVTSGTVSLISDENCAIPLDVVVTNATVVTIKVTSAANLTVKLGLEWD